MVDDLLQLYVVCSISPRASGGQVGQLIYWIPFHMFVEIPSNTFYVLLTPS